MEFDNLTNKVIGAAIEVHKQLGSSLLESAYRRCLEYELTTNGLYCESEVGIPVVYKGIKLDCGYRIDILVEKQLVLELKCVDSIAGIHCSQILTYMKLGNFPLGLILNFHTELLKDNGIKRFVNKYKR